MKITHAVNFRFELALSQPEAVSFVRDVETSLSRVTFIEKLRVSEEALELRRVSAYIPVNAALFGQQRLAFQSQLLPMPEGAELQALPLQEDAPGWAEVAGEARVQPKGGGSEVHYHFDITIHLKLPKAEKWGGRALTKMIHFTAHNMLERITAEFPAAVQAAARAYEARLAA